MEFKRKTKSTTGLLAQTKKLRLVLKVDTSSPDKWIFFLCASLTSFIQGKNAYQQPRASIRNGLPPP